MLKALTRIMLLAVLAFEAGDAMAGKPAYTTLKLPLPVANDIPEKYEPLHLEGSIGRRLPITMDLQFIWVEDYRGDLNLDIQGVYFYHKYRKDILIRGTRKGKEIWLSEYDDNRTLNGAFVGSLISDTCFRGTWTSQDGSRKLPFELHVGDYKIGKAKSLRANRSSRASELADEWDFKPSEDKSPPEGKLEELRATAHCRYQIHEGLPDYHFSLAIDWYSQVRILVSRGEQREFVQSLFVPRFTGFPGGPDFKMLEPLDMNFDGFKDIRFYCDYPPSGNFSCRVWLFDPAKNRFVLSNDLGELTAAVFDPASKTVDWHWRIGAGERIGGISRIDQEGKVTPINELHHRWSQDKKVMMEIRKEFKNGEMVVVSEEPLD